MARLTCVELWADAVIDGTHDAHISFRRLGESVWAYADRVAEAAGIDTPTAIRTA